MSETTDAPPDPAPPRPSRGRETVGDMVRSLALVLALVAVVLLLTLRDEPKQQIREIGYGEQLAQTRKIADYDVLAPVGLGSGWKPTSVRGSTDSGAVTWHLGLVTPEEHYAAVEQSDGPRSRFIDDHAGGAHGAGRVEIAGMAWRRLDGGAPETRALLLSGRGVTTMVAGNATWPELRLLAASLRGG